MTNNVAGLFMTMVLLISGCASTPTGNIEAFGNATKGVTDKIDAVIKEYNDENVRNELTKIAQHNRPIMTATLEPVGKVIIGEADKKKFALYKANNALGGYADALALLAKSGSSEEIDLAASKLFGSLHDFNEQFKSLSNTENNLVKDETSASIGKVIAALGGAYAAQKRGEAIKEIVIQADPSVQTICDVIIKEFMKGAIETRLFTIKHTELSGYIIDYNAKVATASFADKRKWLEEIYGKYRDMQASSAVVSQAIKAINTIKKTHTTLKNDLQKDQFSSAELVRAIGSLKTMQSHYDDLEVLMLSCDTEIVADDTKGIICKNKP